MMYGGTGEGSDASVYVEGLYAQNGPDISFWRILHDLGRLSDERLAELIEEDGRVRIARGLPVRLDRYIAAVPDLLTRCDPVDAAIDVTLRSICGSSRPDSEAVDALIREYPQLESLIREAAILSNALWSTTEIREDVEPGPPRAMPQDFGPPLESGESRYELRRPLGSGAFGHVYLAVDRLLSEDDRPALVAIKVLKPRRRSRWSRQRLIEEASKARRVDHPNVVRVLDRGVSTHDEDFITYEYVTGGDLDRWLIRRGGKAAPREAARLVAKIARGVQAAHSAGLVHCDLQPGNILLTDDEEPKVTDFGVATRADETGQRELRHRETGRPIGNKLFISPEQYRCEEGSLTVPSDIYGLGGILFTLLTGSLPNGSTLEEIADTHDLKTGRAEAPSVRRTCPNLDGDLDAICRRALAPRPENRYNSAGAFADDLEAWLQLEPIPWTKPSGLRLARLWVRRKPAVAGVSALLITSIVSFGGWALYAERMRQLGEIRILEAVAAQQAEEFRAELERVRAEEEAERNARVLNAAARWQGIVELMRTDRATSQPIPVLWAIEYVLDSNVLGMLHETTDFWDTRFDTVQRLVEQAEAQGRGNDLETLLWRTTLAFWLVTAGEVRRADSMLPELEQRWTALLRPDDLWLGHLAAIRACADVKRVLANGEHPDAPSTREALAQARVLLEAHEPVLERDDRGSPLHVLVLESLRDLYTAIDAHQKRDQTAAQLASLRQRQTPAPGRRDVGR